MESKEIHKEDRMQHLSSQSLAGCTKVFSVSQACSGNAYTASRLKTESALWPSAHYRAPLCWSQSIVNASHLWEYVILRVGYSTHIWEVTPHEAKVLDYVWVFLTPVLCLWHWHMPPGSPETWREARAALGHPPAVVMCRCGRGGYSHAFHLTDPTLQSRDPPPSIITRCACTVTTQDRPPIVRAM